MHNSERDVTVFMKMASVRLFFMYYGNSASQFVLAELVIRISEYCQYPVKGFKASEKATASAAQTGYVCS
ncbi:hypothetical protein FACS1894211_00010 [Clostridia bacterium]|nr:hypothetical protein FACS1894211_00010 [Clostridia bacterium]